MLDEIDARAVGRGERAQKTMMDGAPKVNSGGAGPVTSVRGGPSPGSPPLTPPRCERRVDVDEKDGLALQGTTASAITPGRRRATPGHPRLSSTPRTSSGSGAYLFATAENAERFRREHVSQNAPAYGGFCAEGVARGEFKRADPNQWCLADDGRLFLFCCAEMRAAWEGEALTARRVAADSAWPKLAGGGDSRAAAA